LWLNDTSSAKVSEEVNRKCPLGNTTVQLPTPTPTVSATIHLVTDRLTDRQSDRVQTDHSITPIAYRIRVAVHRVSKKSVKIVFVRTSSNFQQLW